jgi:hypothetical protein
VGALSLEFTLLEADLAVCRLERSSPLPAWAMGGPFVSITRTADELSVICPGDAVPAGIVSAPGWRCLKLEGPFDFSATGLVSAFSGLLARAGISLMVVCTYDTDYLLVRSPDLDRTIACLEKGGYRIRR